MSSQNFNESLYQVTLQSLVENKVPNEVAKGAARVVASDDPYSENLGRSPEDQSIVDQAMQHYQNNQ